MTERGTIPRFTGTGFLLRPVSYRDVITSTLLNYSFFSTFLFFITIVEHITTSNAIRIIYNELCWDRTRRIIEIISTFLLNSENVEF